MLPARSRADIVMRIFFIKIEISDKIIKFILYYNPNRVLISWNFSGPNSMVLSGRLRNSAA